MSVFSPSWLYLGHLSTQIPPEATPPAPPPAQTEWLVGESFAGSDIQGVTLTGEAGHDSGTAFLRELDLLRYRLATEDGTQSADHAPLEDETVTTYSRHLGIHAEIAVLRGNPDHPDGALPDRITLRATLIQMTNGDLFLAPSGPDLMRWNNTLRNTEVTAITVAALEGAPAEHALGDAAALDATTGFDPALFAGNAPVPCFVAGTMIATEFGLQPVEELREGDCVWTRDHGLQAIRWTGARRLDPVDLGFDDKLRPIRIRAHALGQGTPSADLLVSPQHRVLLHSRIALKLFGTDEVLVAAKQLLALEGVEIAADLDDVTYVHILFDQHEIVLSNDTETESLFTGPEALRSVGPAARAEIFTLFPELEEPDYLPQSARRILTGRQARDLVRRHLNQHRRAHAGEA